MKSKTFSIRPRRETLIARADLLVPGISSVALRPVALHAWISTRWAAATLDTVEVLVKDDALLQFAKVVTTHAVDL